MKHNIAPPRIARWIFSLMLPNRDGIEFVHELDGDFRTRVREHGRRRAVLWYWRQLLHIDVWRLRREYSLRDRGSSKALPRAAILDRVHQDVRVALRTFRRHPSFAATVVLTLALGIGANSAIFSVVNGVLLRPLPYPNPDRLVFVWVHTADDAQTLFSGPGSADFTAERQSFADVTRVFGQGRSTFDFGDGPEETMAAAIDPNAFTVYGVTPVVGRNLLPTDRHPLSVGQMRDPDLIRPTGVLVLSHEFWTSRFGADSSVIGRIVSRGGHAAEIVGVQPPGFVMHLPAALGGAHDPDVWYVPYWDQSLFPRDEGFVRVVARLAPGVLLEQAQAQADIFAQQQREQYQEQAARHYGVHVAPLHDGVVTEAARPVLILLGAVACVLLIACANVANLSLAQALSRNHEWTVRATVGARWWRLVQQSLTESGVLALIGAGLGLLIAWIAVPLLLRLTPTTMPRANEIGVDGVLFGFTAATTVFATFVFGSLPALRAARVNAADVLKSRTSMARRQHRLRAGLVAAEIALAVILVVGTGLLLRSFIGLIRVDPGFDPTDVLTAQVTPTSQHYPTPSSRIAFYRQLHDRFAAINGVEAVGMAQPLPFQGLQITDVAARKRDGTLVNRRVGLRQWFPGTFEVLKMRLRAGRFFDWTDFQDVNQFTVVVDENLARALWPDTDPLGQQIEIKRREYGASNDDIWLQPYWATVVGVVQPIHGLTLDQADLPSVFVTFHQNPWAVGDFAIRTTRDAGMVAQEMRAALQEINSSYPLAQVTMLDDDVSASLAPIRFSLTLIGLFGVISLTLAFVGVYGVIAYNVRQRTAEIGMRIALGAEARDVMSLILGDGLRITIPGLLIGVAGALTAARVLDNQLFNVTHADLSTYLVVTLLLLGTSVFASYIPTRKAARMNPISTLRSE